MSDEMMLQNQRPSAVPYLLGGAAVGGAAGALQPWVGVKQAKYASFDDILKDTKDTFAKAKEDAKKDDVKEAYNKIIAERETYDKVAEKAAADKKAALADPANASWDAKIEAEGKAFEAAQAETTTARENLNKAVEDAIKADKIKVDGLSAADAAKPENADKLSEVAKKYVKDNMSKLKEDNSAVSEFKEVQAEANGLFAKAKEETTKLEALNNKAKTENVKAEKTLTDAGKKAIADIEKTVTDAKTKASEALKDVLGKIKKPNRLVNGLIGGAVLALGALLLRQSSKE